MKGNINKYTFVYLPIHCCRRRPKSTDFPRLFPKIFLCTYIYLSPPLLVGRRMGVCVCVTQKDADVIENDDGKSKETKKHGGTVETIVNRNWVTMFVLDHRFLIFSISETLYNVRFYCWTRTLAMFQLHGYAAYYKWVIYYKNNFIKYSGFFVGKNCIKSNPKIPIITGKYSLKIWILTCTAKFKNLRVNYSD